MLMSLPYIFDVVWNFVYIANIDCVVTTVWLVEDSMIDQILLKELTTQFALANMT